MDLKELRKSKNLSQKEVSETFEIPLRTYKRIENEERYKNSFKYREIYEKMSKLSVEVSAPHIDRKNILVIGGGYVGLPLAASLCLDHNVTVLDIDKEKVNLIRRNQSPFQDEGLQFFLDKNKGLIHSSSNFNVVKKADIIFICLPSNLDKKTNTLDTSIIEEEINNIVKLNKACLIVIKSTTPIGFTQDLIGKFKRNIVFCPEFSREGNGYNDVINPDRIVIGIDRKSKQCSELVSMMSKFGKIVITSTKEAETIKLFSNQYLAMRVAYFNELDSFALENGLNTKKIIEGVCLDQRIGDKYNRPSFGFGGSCLLKDNFELKEELKNGENNQISQVILESNENRMIFIAKTILEEAKKRIKNKKIPTIGIYRLLSKKNGDNFNNSPSLKLYFYLSKFEAKVLIYDKKFEGSVSNFKDFVSQADLIVSEHIDERIMPYRHKIFTRDIDNLWKIYLLTT